MESKLQGVPQPGASPTATPTPTPTQFKHYLIRQHLGEGGFGQVFEAWDNKLRRSVAIKRLKNLADAAHPTKLIKEAQLAASLQHAAFVKIYALEDDDNSHSIVMELVRGQTLKQMLASTPPDQARVLDMVRQIAQGMQEAHDAGLIHGDLKPSNLMLEPSGTVRILDFGLATQGDADATTSLLQTDPQGTIAYMAPERLLGAPLQRQSDIYALGVILYELLTGARPFANLNGLALAAAHMQSSAEQWKYPAELPLALVQLIRAMTAREQAQRLQGMAQVVDMLAQLSVPSVQSVQISGPISKTTVLPQTGVGHSANLPALRPGKHTRMVLISLASCTLLGAASWQLLPHVWQTPMLAPPYSEALELKNGLTALTLFDRPGSLENAMMRFNRILERNPKNAAAVAGLALAYSYRYQSDEQDDIWLEKADVAAKQAMILNDQLALCHIAEAFILLHRGKFELGLAASERALKLEPLNFFAWNAKLAALRRGRDVVEALKFGQLALQRFPQERIFADELGLLYIQQGSYLEAEKILRQSITLQPDAVYAYAMLAGALLHQNKQDEALQVLQQGLQIRPGSLLYGNLGNVLFARGDYLAAARAFEYAVSPDKGNPADYLGWANLADTLLWIPGKASEAKRAYEKARELLAPRLMRRKNDATLVSRMGLYAARVGSHTEAKTLMVQAVQLTPGVAIVHFRAGLAYELLGERKMALAAIAKAKSLGYPVKSIAAEPDLVALRRDPEYL